MLETVLETVFPLSIAGRPFYWRTKSGSEVDFVVYGPDVFWAMEVKRSSRVHKRDIRHLKSFCQDYPEAGGILIYMGHERLLMDGIMCVPCQEFLLGLNPVHFSPDWLV